MKGTNRRNFLACGAAAVAGLPAAPEEGTAILAFSDRAHLIALPVVKEKPTWCFATVLGCGAPASLNAPGLAEPILALRFTGGGSLSVEFTSDGRCERSGR